MRLLGLPGLARRLGGPSAAPEDVRRKEIEERYRQRLVAPVTPPPCPPGWTLGPPTFVGVGSQKSGTAWWFRAICQHPQVVSSVRKELHFFQHYWEEEFTQERIEEYHSYFPRSDAMLTGEWTPRYMLDPGTPRRLRQAAPDARLLVLLRDPLARFSSGLRHHKRSQSALHPRFVLESFERGRYASQLAQLTTHFPREQVLVLQLERCSTTPEAELARTFEFIGADPSFCPPDLHERFHEGQGPVVKVPSDLLEFARQEYTLDARRLASDWPEIDLDLWPGVSSTAIGA